MRAFGERTSKWRPLEVLGIYIYMYIYTIMGTYSHILQIRDRFQSFQQVPDLGLVAGASLLNKAFLGLC